MKRSKRRIRTPSTAAEVRDALSGVCVDCALAAFERGPRGEVIGGSMVTATRWTHDAVDALLEARKLRATMRRETVTTRSLDRELAAALDFVECVIADAMTLEDLVECGAVGAEGMVLQ